eukprot:134738_1
MSNKAGRSPVQWILLARQDLTGKNGGYFASKSEVTKNVDADINTVKLYANLKINYDEYRDYDGNLFFMIVWPGLSNSGNVAKLFVEGMIWSQTSIPTARQVENYKAIFVPYPGPGNKDFGGIEKSNKSSPSVIDGNAGISNYHYAVGTTQRWSTGIPGPIAHGIEYAVSSVELYVFDYKNTVKQYAKSLHEMRQNSNEWTEQVAFIVAQYAFNDTNLIRQSICKLYPH